MGAGPRAAVGETALLQPDVGEHRLVGRDAAVQQAGPSATVLGCGRPRGRSRDHRLQPGVGIDVVEIVGAARVQSRSRLIAARALRPLGGVRVTSERPRSSDWVWRATTKPAATTFARASGVGETASTSPRTTGCPWSSRSSARGWARTSAVRRSSRAAARASGVRRSARLSTSLARRSANGSRGSGSPVRSTTDDGDGSSWASAGAPPSAARPARIVIRGMRKLMAIQSFPDGRDVTMAASRRA